MALRPASAQEIARALGGGKEQKTNGGWKTLCPLHDDSEPSMIIYEQGDKDKKPWPKCMVCGTSKALYNAIEERTGMCFEARANEQKQKMKAIYPAPIKWSPVRVKGVAPSAHWEYTDEHGTLLFVVARWDTINGKKIYPYSVVDQNGQPAWKSCMRLKTPPLYNAKALHDSPDAPVLIVEGEKTADAASQYKEFEDYVVVTYQGGANNWKKADKAPLKGRNILLWPDNDHPGKETFMNIARFLNTENFCKSVKMAIIPHDFPKKWDLADDWPDGHDMSHISFKDGPKPDRAFKLRQVDPANYMEVFDSLYYLYHDGSYTYTISKEYREARKGCAVTQNETYTKMQINPHHEAYDACLVDRKPALKYWAAEKMRDGDYIKGFGFFPGHDQAIVNDNGVMKYNSFTGWMYPPKMSGSCDLFKSFVLETICNNDKRAYAYVFNFLSHIIQYPEEKPNVAILFKGKKGTGKSFFMKAVFDLLGGVFGYGFSVNSSATFDSAFTGAYSTANLGIFVHEWEITKSRKIENKVKSLITEDILEVNIKQVKNYQTRNYTRVMGATNHNHIWNTTEDERRISLFEVGENHAQDTEYFAAIHAELRNGGFERLAYELSEHEVNKDLVRTHFVNKALSIQKELSKTPAQQMAYDMLKRGEVYLRTFDERNEVIDSYSVVNEDWAQFPIALPSRLIDEVLARQYMKKAYEGGYAFGSKDGSAKGVYEWMGGSVGRSNVGIVSHGTQKRLAGQKVATLHVAREAYAERAGMSVGELFYEEADVIPFPKNQTNEAPF